MTTACTVTPQTQVFTGGLWMGNGIAANPIAYPILPGFQFSWPKNYAIPAILGNYWQFNYVEGLRLPTLTVDLVPRDKAGEAFSFPGTYGTGGPLSFALLRNIGDVIANDIAIVDTAASTVTAFQGCNLAGNIIISNGRKALLLLGAKIDGFVISVGSKGDDLRFRLRIVACACVPISAPTLPVWDSSPPLRFQSADFRAGDGTTANALTNSMTSFSLTFSNNCTPDPSLNGTTAPVAINAGLPTCSFSTNVQAANLVDQSLDGTSGCLVLGSPTHLLKLKLALMLNATPDELIATAPRVLTPHQFIVRGDNSGPTPPLTVLSSTF